ncbi:hypothetical protein [Castellaniella sp. GW247-6E4]|uniref:hypothetical protein n=1 Tax=Castellaniella sp. GW247-6E4 TaxID=3140380 RepID=UPI00331577ED
MNYGNTPALFSDALERAYTQAVMDTSESLSIKDMVKSIARGAKRIGSRTARTIGEVINAQAEARARDARYSRSQW